MRTRIAFVLAVACAALGAAAARAQTADEILARVDANESYSSIRYGGRMEITIGGETRSKTMDAIARGSSRAFVEFTNPEDRGTRYLKRDKNLWIYFPREQDTVKLSGHLLKEGMMGSDVSYEDALESSNYAEKYAAARKPDETVGDRPCFVVELTAKVPTAAYDRRVLWIDSQRFVNLKEEMYARSGRLLKTSATLEVDRIGERWFPARLEFVSRLRANTKTVFSMSRIELNVPVTEQQFSLAALTR